jgi:hypothetical protein
MKNTALLLSLLLLLTSCPREPFFYAIIVRNPNKIENLKIFIHLNSPGDSLLPSDNDKFNAGLWKFDTGGAAFRVCRNEIRGICDCIESQPEKKIYMFVFDADTLAAYDYAVIRDKKKYKDRVEIPYTLATNDANLIIEYP